MLVLVCGHRCGRQPDMVGLLHGRISFLIIDTYHGSGALKALPGFMSLLSQPSGWLPKAILHVGVVLVTY